MKRVWTKHQTKQALGAPKPLCDAADQDLYDLRDKCYTLAKKVEREGLLNSVVTVKPYDYSEFTEPVTLRGICLADADLRIMAVCTRFPRSVAVWLIDYNRVFELVVLDRENDA